MNGRTDPFSFYLYDQLSDETKQALSNTNEGALQSLLTDELNELMKSDYLFDPERCETLLFDSISQKQRIESMYKTKGLERFKLNRELLSIAYPQEIAGIPATLQWRERINSATRRIERRLVLQTAPLRMQPRFMIVGAQRCGTTSMYAYLCQHPLIYPARHKEIYYFNNPYRDNIASYRSNFPIALFKPNNAITGEATPAYMYKPNCLERIRQKFPDVKLIVLLRNPVDRAFSQYRAIFHEKRDTLLFEEAVKTEADRLRGEYERETRDPHYGSIALRDHGYLARGRYAEQLARMFDLFPREQVHVIQSEVMYENTEQVYSQLLDFLGLPAYTPKSLANRTQELREDHTFASNCKTTRMSSEIRQYLVDYFKPHNNRLYDMLKCDFGWDK